MAITETPVINHLTFQAWDDVLGAWRDLATKATAVNITRGGSRNGALNSIAVGTLDATLYGEIDLRTDAALRPNAPIRVIHAAKAGLVGAVNRFPYPSLEDAANLGVANYGGGLTSTRDTTQAFSGTASRKTVQATSGVVMGSEIGATVATGAAVTPGEYVVLSISAYYMTAVSNMAIRWNFRNAAGTSVGNGATAKAHPGTGWSRFNTAAILVPAGAAFVSVIGSGVAAFAGDALFVDAARCAPSTGDLVADSVYFDGATADTADYDYAWTGAANASPSVRTIRDYPVFTGALSDLAQSVQFDKASGKRRLYTALYAVDAVSSLANTPRSGAVSSPGYETWAARIARLMTSALVPYALPAESAGDPDRVRSVVFDSSLVSHLDLACSSVGARWWVDKAGVLQFDRGLTAPGAPAVAFSDTDAAALHYTDLTMAFDTRNVVNDLTLNQHGWKLQTNSDGTQEEVADDVSLRYTQDPSIAYWGARAGTLDTSVWEDVTTYAGRIEAAARRILAKLNRPRLLVSSIKWNAQENPGALKPLDIYSLVGLTYNGAAQTARVVAMRHTITPTRWMVQVDFTDLVVGTTFADFNVAWGHRTFSQFDAYQGHRTFRDFVPTDTPQIGA